jgi:hypothetical protein
VTVQTISRYEVAVANALRARADQWLPEYEVWLSARAYTATPRRTVRHHLARFVRLGLVETTEIDPLPGGIVVTMDHYRWRYDAPVEVVAALEAAAVDAQLLLEPASP